MRINVLMVNTELWALQLRLTYEYDFFDKFIVIESRVTFAGIKKPLYTEIYRNDIYDPKNKIRYVYLDSLPWEPEREYLSRDGVRVKGNRWPAEVASRNAATRPLSEMVESPHDTIVCQDADEIGNLDAIERAERELDLLGLQHLSYIDYRGSVAAKDRREAVLTAGFVMRAAMLGHDLHDLRRVGRRGDGLLVYWHVVGPHICSQLDGTPMYPQMALPRFFHYTRQAHADYKRGWHLTNMTGGFAPLLANKFRSYAHVENDRASDKSPPAQETGDLWAAAKAYMNSADYRNFAPDPECPEWITAQLNAFPILKTPQVGLS